MPAVTDRHLTHSETVHSALISHLASTTYRN
jgi:hypothetical protein